MSSNPVQHTFRLPPALFKKLIAEAKAEERSANAQVAVILAQHYAVKASAR